MVFICHWPNSLILISKAGIADSVRHSKLIQAAFGIVMSLAWVQAGEIQYDIVPSTWITHNGNDNPSISNEGELLIFPGEADGSKGSKDGKGAEGFHVGWSMLARGNHISTAGHLYCLVDQGECRCKDHASPVSIRIRREAKTYNLCFELDAASHNYLRTRSWEQFRKIQMSFEMWMLQKAANCDPTTLIWKTRQRFNHGPCAAQQEKKSGSLPAADCYEYGLRSFWIKVVEKSRFESFRECYLENNTIEPPKEIPESVACTGKYMGAIPLRDGMRLAIHWGGTAPYSYRNDKFAVVRQTTAGCYKVGVVASPNGLVLDHYGKGGTSNTTPLSIPGVFPKSSDTNVQNREFFPFGDGARKGARGKLAPVDCLLDLYNPAIFKPIKNSKLISPESRSLPVDVRGNAMADGVPYLTLLIPCEYAKADNFATSSGKGNAPDTSDALADGDGNLSMADEASLREDSAAEQRIRKREWLDEIEYKNRVEEKMAIALTNPLPESERLRFTRIQEVIHAERKLLAEEEGRSLLPSDKAQAEGPWIAALRRRFILWPSGEIYVRDRNAPEIPAKGGGEMGWKNWHFVPMVFGNQTTVEVEVPVWWNGREETKFVYHSWLDCLKDLAGASSGRDFPETGPRLEITRTTPVARSSRSREATVRIFRFHTISTAVLSRVGIQPNDSFQY